MYVQLGFGVELLGVLWACFLHALPTSLFSCSYRLERLCCPIFCPDTLSTRPCISLPVLIMRPPPCRGVPSLFVLGLQCLAARLNRLKAAPLRSMTCLVLAALIWVAWPLHQGARGAGEASGRAPAEGLAARGAQPQRGALGRCSTQSIGVIHIWPPYCMSRVHLRCMHARTRPRTPACIVYEVRKQPRHLPMHQGSGQAGGQLNERDARRPCASELTEYLWASLCNPTYHGIVTEDGTLAAPPSLSAA